MMTDESMSDLEVKDLISSLKTEIGDLKTEIKSKKDTERSEVISEIAVLAKVLDEGFDEKEFDDMSLDNLFIFKKQYKKLIDLKEKAISNEANFVDRTKITKFEGKSDREVFYGCVDIVSNMWNLPNLTDEQKEDVRFQHEAENLIY